MFWQRGPPKSFLQINGIPIVGSIEGSIVEAENNKKIMGFQEFAVKFSGIPENSWNSNFRFSKVGVLAERSPKKSCEN